MKTQRDDIDSYIDALRGNLPSEHDEARVRARLLASGVLVAASTVTSGVAAATSGLAAGGSAGAVGSLGSAPAGLVKVGLFSKVIALPLAAKVGATTVAVALAAGVPIAFEAEVAPTARTSRAVTAPAESRTSPAVPSAVESRTSPAVPAPRTSPAVPALQSAPAPEASEPLAVAPRPMVGAITRPAAILSAPPEPTPPRAAAAERVATSAPAQAQFPAEPAPALAAEPAPALASEPVQPSPSTLAEETRLMERAMAALGAGDRADAGYWLAEHERRFPQGLLTRERLRTLERLRQWAASHNPSATTP